MTETQLQAAIVRALKRIGFWVIRTQVTGRRGARSVATGEPGMPDLYLPGIGHLEVKLPGARIEDAQLEWHERARKKGVWVYVARDVVETLDAVRARRAQIEASMWRIGE